METDFLTTPPEYVESMTAWGWFFAVLFALLAVIVLVASLVVHKVTSSASFPLGCSVMGALLGVCSLFSMFRAVPPLSSGATGWVIGISFIALVTVIAGILATKMDNFSGIGYPLGGAALSLFCAALLDKFFESLAVIPLSIAGFALIIILVFAWARDQ